LYQRIDVRKDDRLHTRADRLRQFFILVLLNGCQKNGENYFIANPKKSNNPGSEIYLCALYRLNA
jgi:hypothetical protein